MYREFDMLQNYLSQLENTLWQLFKMPVWLWGFSAQICEVIGLNPNDDTQRTFGYLTFVVAIELFHGIPWSLYTILFEKLSNWLLMLINF